MKRPIAVLVALGLAAGCKDKPASESAPPKAEQVLPGTDAMDLAPSAMSTKAPAAAGYSNHVFAYTAARGLTLDGKVIVPPPTSPTKGFDLKDKRNGPNDLSIAPLQDAIAKNKGDTALLAIEGATPYRIVAEIAFTLGQGGATTLDFLVRSPAGERRVFTMPLPTSVLPCGRTIDDMNLDIAALRALLGDAAAPTSPGSTVVPLASRTPICLSLDMASDGLGVRSRTDRLDASCADLAKDAVPTATTLPAESGKLPLGAASICANTIKKRFPQAAASRVTVRASGETPWRDVVAVIDTFGPPGGFGDPILAAPK